MSDINMDLPQLRSFITLKQILANYRHTQAAQSEWVTAASLYIEVSRDEYETLVNLAIEALQKRVTNEGKG